MRLDALRFLSYRQGAFYSTLLNVVSRGMGFVVNLVIAYHFGADKAVGVYFYCLTAVFTIGLFLGMVNASVLIPESMRIAERQGESHSQAFLNVFLLGYALFGFALTLLLQFYPVDLLLLLSRFDRPLLEAHSGIVLLTTLLLPLVILSAFLVEILNSRRFFTVAMLANLTSGLCAMVFILLFRGTLGVRSIAVGMLVGYLAQVGGALLLMKRLLHWRFGPSCQYLERQVWKDIVLAQAGNASTTLVAYLPFFLLSNYSASLVAALTFGLGLAMLPNTILSDQISAVTGIKLNTLLSSHRYEEVNSAFLRSAKLLFFVLVPISVCSVFYGKSLVSLVYGRGAFDAVAVRDSYRFFRLLVCLAPLIAVNSLVSKLFTGARKIREAVWYQIALNVFLALAIILGVEFSGPFEYPVGLLIVYGLNFFTCYYLIQHYFPSVHYGELVKDACSIIGVNALIAFALYWARGGELVVGTYGGVIIGAGAYAAAIVILNHFLCLNTDFKEIMAGLLSRGK